MILSQFGVTIRPDEAPVGEPSAIVFRDDFNYVVDRNADGAQPIFQAHGWTGCKTEQDVLSGNPYGFIYTVPSIPGYAGGYPSAGRMLCIEALPATYASQTDVYLEYGDGESAAYNDYIPGDVWFSYWYFINHSGAQLSQMREQKFIYACNGSYGCHTHNWMSVMGTASTVPYWNYLGVGGLTDGDMYINISANWEKDAVTNPLASPGDEWKLGQTNISEWVRPNRWQRITQHMNTTGGFGSWECWIEPMGGTKIKVAEWISGVNGFIWPIAGASGHRTFRMPTTVGSTGGPWYDQWAYMKDFRIARTEAGLL